MMNLPMQAPIPPARPGNVGGLGGLGGKIGGFLSTPQGGNLLQALGISLMGSPRNAPLQNFGPTLMGLQDRTLAAEKDQRALAKEAEEREALISAAVAMGLSRDEAQALSANPTALKLRLDQAEAEKASQRAKDFWTQLDAPYQPPEAIEQQPVSADPWRNLAQQFKPGQDGTVATPQPVQQPMQVAQAGNRNVEILLAQRDRIARAMAMAPDEATRKGLEARAGQIDVMLKQISPTDTQTNLQWRAEQAGLVPGSEEYRDFMLKGGTGPQVVIGGDGAPGLGKLSADYGYVLGPDGKPVIDPATGLPQAAVVPGSPAAKEMEAAQRKQATAMRAYDQKFNIVDSAIENVVGNISGWTAGPGGAVLSNIPGTDAYDLAATIETIKANLGFEELQNMRDSSPTGGALGQVTERELAFLQAAQGNLDQAQTPAQLKQVLNEIRARRKEFREAKRRAYEIDYGVPMPGGAPDDDVSLDELLDRYGD